MINILQHHQSTNKFLNCLSQTPTPKKKTPINEFYFLFFYEEMNFDESGFI